MSEKPEEQGGLASRTLAPFLKSAAEKQQKELLEKLYLRLYYDSLNVTVSSYIEDEYLYVNDHSKPIEWRVDEMNNLVSRLTTLAGARDDPLTARARNNFHTMIHTFWYSDALMYLQKRRAIGRARDPRLRPLSDVVEVVTRFGERWVIPWGKWCVDQHFGAAFTSPQFVVGMQTPPPMFGFGAGDTRYSGPERFLEDEAAEEAT